MRHKLLQDKKVEDLNAVFSEQGNPMYRQGQTQGGSRKTQGREHGQKE